MILNPVSRELFHSIHSEYGWAVHVFVNFGDGWNVISYHNRRYGVP
jgi:hypothetical protein